MKRTIAAVVAGLLFWAAFGSLLIGALRVFWPDYAVAHPMRDFTFPMQMARLVVGAVATLGAGAVARRIAGTGGRAVMTFGILLLLANLFVHLQEPTWSDYPLWYHIVFLGYLVPLTLLGGWLATRSANNAASEAAMRTA
jgi:hypothetical protein